MSRFRGYLFAVVITGIAFTTLALFLDGTLRQYASRYFWLLVGLLLFVTLIYIAVYAIVKLTAKDKGRIAFGVMLVILAFEFMIGTVIADWWIGPGIRSAIPGLQLKLHVPKGNLLFVGGKEGWVYAVLFIALGVAIFFKKFVRIIELLFSKVPRHERTPRAAKEPKVRRSKRVKVDRRARSAPEPTEPRRFRSTDHSDTDEHEIYAGTGPGSPSGP